MYRYVEARCQGFMGISMQCLLKDIGIAGLALMESLKQMAEETEKGSFWLW